ncbi:DUF2334 domain-containing protein [Geodermatophilus sp. SYSU D01062]
MQRHSGSRPARRMRWLVALLSVLAVLVALGPPALAAPPAPPGPPGTDPADAPPAPGLATDGDEPAVTEIPPPPRPQQPQREADATALPESALADATVAATGALVLYDSGGEWGWLGELYAQQTANLAGRFGSYHAQPVSSYQAGQMASYESVVYIGSTYDEPLPPAFLSDVLATKQQVLWMGFNIWQLFNASPTFVTDRGWNWVGYDFATVNQVRYKNQALERDGTNNQGGIMNVTITDPAKATALAQAVRSDGSTFPWATRSGNLTYIGEIPYAYQGMSDRYLAAADLFYDVLAPETGVRHRALVRIEDVGPDADPQELRAMANTLSNLRVPFSFGVFTRYEDPNGVYNNGTPRSIRLRDVPAVVDAIKYMISRGGTMIMHGYTHQFSPTPNPYSGASGDDFEFFLAHVDATDTVRLDGPVPGDGAAYVNSRVDAAAAEFRAVGLPVPTIFEFPHYAGSAADYRAIGQRFTTRYERTLYFGGLLTTGQPDYSRIHGQFFPYPVTDIYGTRVLPENIGNYEPEAFNNHPARFPADIVASARANLVVRDGYASFFYHPYLGTAALREIVNGIKGLGYTFVAPSAV